MMPVLILFVAFFYAAVGHGGASGYLAVMAVYGVPSAEMRFSALVLNLAVSALSFFQYFRAGHFRWSLFWPFALASVPAAYLGGAMQLNDPQYKQLLGAALILSVLRLLGFPKIHASASPGQQRAIPMGWALGIGGGIGFISGLIGIGGGIILSPVLLLLGWADMKKTAAVSALFIFVNSLSGLAAQLQKGAAPDFSWPLLLAALAGGWLGAWLGAQRISSGALRYFLAFVLSIAAVKLLLGV
jgi:uncharacterized protein